MSALSNSLSRGVPQPSPVYREAEAVTAESPFLANTIPWQTQLMTALSYSPMSLLLIADEGALHMNLYLLTCFVPSMSGSVHGSELTDLPALPCVYMMYVHVLYSFTI